MYRVESGKWGRSFEALRLDEQVALGVGVPVVRLRDFTFVLSSIVAFELWCGVGKSQRKASNTQRLEAFLAGPLEWTLFDEDDARAAGTVRADLEAVGKPVGAYDVLLAGQARRRGATLVTSNTKGFARVQGLKWEDWAASRR